MDNVGQGYLLMQHMDLQWFKILLLQYVTGKSIGSVMHNTSVIDEELGVFGESNWIKRLSLRGRVMTVI